MRFKHIGGGSSLILLLLMMMMLLLLLMMMLLLLLLLIMLLFFKFWNKNNQDHCFLLLSNVKYYTYVFILSYDKRLVICLKYLPWNKTLLVKMIITNRCVWVCD
jgi:hypothetical protein